MKTIVYLHGFVSSPRSKKAMMLGDYLANCVTGVEYRVPNLHHRPSVAMDEVQAACSATPAEDLTLVGFAKPTIVVIPKAEDPEFVRTLATRFADHGAATALMIETATGVACSMEIMGAHEAVCMVIFGSADLLVPLGVRVFPREPILH